MSHGFDEANYLNALAKVPVFSKEKVQAAMDFLLNMIQLNSEMIFQKRQELENELLSCMAPLMDGSCNCFYFLSGDRKSRDRPVTGSQ
jgi:hypothetical protein